MDAVCFGENSMRLLRATNFLNIRCRQLSKCSPKHESSREGVLHVLFVGAFVKMARIYAGFIVAFVPRQAVWEPPICQVVGNSVRIFGPQRISGYQSVSRAADAAAPHPAIVWTGFVDVSPEPLVGLVHDVDQRC